MDVMKLSERRVCQTLGIGRSSIRYRPTEAFDEEQLTRRIVELASAYGRYGYRRITAMLRMDGWRVNHKRVERIWRAEGPKAQARQPSSGLLTAAT